jgi:hypothetical protein
LREPIVLLERPESSLQPPETSQVDADMVLRSSRRTSVDPPRQRRSMGALAHLAVMDAIAQKNLARQTPPDSFDNFSNAPRPTTNSLDGPPSPPSLPRDDGVLRVGGS